MAAPKKPPTSAIPPAVAYSYIRFSTPEQRTGDSLRRQVELRDAWVKKTGAILDESVSLRDDGVSGFSGKHRDNPDRHALAAFLRLVEKGRIPRGSYLVVENLDRLSREHIRPALTLLLNLIEAGVRVVQLLPVEHVFDEHVEPMQLMMAIMELSRGHSESKMKSERVGRAWEQLKRDAATTKEPITARVPAWLEVVNGKMRVVPKRAAVIRRIFRMAADGHGFGAIVKQLNTEGVPVIGRAEFWARSYIAKVLNNRACLGEYQPFTVKGLKKRRPDGQPIPGYFPAVITEAEWHAARLAMAGRKNTTGAPIKDGEEVYVGIFTGLLVDARDGGALHYASKGKKSSGLVLVPYKAAQGMSSVGTITFPAPVFEKAVLSQLREIDPRAILPRGNPAADRVTELAGREVELSARVEKIKAAMMAGGEVESAIDVLRKLDGDLVAVRAELAQARADAASPLSAAWGEVRPLVEMLATAPDPHEARTRLRAAVRRVVSEVRCLFVPADDKRRSVYRVGVVQVRFHGGGQRDYFILSRRGRGGSCVTPAAHWVRSCADAGLGDGFDLRQPADVKAMVKVVSAMDVALLMDDEAETNLERRRGGGRSKRV